VAQEGEGRRRRRGKGRKGLLSQEGEDRRGR